jgi:thioredoxin-dependent peroxiredoxin
MSITTNNELTKLEVGQIAPDFSAKVQEADGNVSEVNLHKFLQEKNSKGKENKVLLIFYPGDDTPGCTKQLCGIRDVYQEYEELGVTVLGVNPADQKSHLKFIQKYNFPFGIIVDEDKTIREKYGAIKKFFVNLTTKRGVFLIGKNAEILFIHWGQQDNQKIIEMLKESNVS